MCGASLADPKSKDPKYNKYCHPPSTSQLYLYFLQNVKILCIFGRLKLASSTEEEQASQDQERNVGIGRLLVACIILEITTTAETQTHSGKLWLYR